MASNRKNSDGFNGHFFAPLVGVFGLSCVLFLFCWLFQDILLPFVIGGVIAYLLDPLVERLAKIQKIHRSWVVFSILLLFFIIVAVLFILLVPLIYRESVEFIVGFPGYIEKFSLLIDPYLHQAREILGLNSKQDFEQVLTKYWKEVLNFGTQAGNVLGSAGQGLISFITVPIFSLIIAYFMLYEWPHISKWAEDMIPRPYVNDVKDLGLKMNIKISGFVRGQLIVAFVLGIVYAITLSLAGLNYAILIGLMSGVLGIIPMVGSIVGLLVSVFIAYFQEGTLLYVGLIAGIFLAGQLIEGNFLTPKIVGDSVGLHPLWIFFALLAGAALMGILGMLLAVPVAAIVSVLLSYFIMHYKKSVYYTGKS